MLTRISHSKGNLDLENISLSLVQSGMFNTTPQFSFLQFCGLGTMLFLVLLPFSLQAAASEAQS